MSTFNHPAAQAILKDQSTDLITKMKQLYKLSPVVFSTSAMANHFGYSQSTIIQYLWQNNKKENGIHTQKYTLPLDSPESSPGGPKKYESRQVQQHRMEKAARDKNSAKPLL